MKPRKAEYGDKNICGANAERIRKEMGMKQTTLVAKMQLAGVDINPSSLSKLKGQIRIASDLLQASKSPKIRGHETAPKCPKRFPTTGWKTRLRCQKNSKEIQVTTFAPN
ncbi:MAG: hypothetical protein IJ001_13085 [Oscillospiraceae bacterium]|nr:hypothetical protein [Oscillospiraceae bacterium]